MPGIYRDVNNIVRDIILTLIKNGGMNQTKLLSLCGLNLKTHRTILDSLVKNHLIEVNLDHYGRREVTVYTATLQGVEFYKSVLMPFEEAFPLGTKK